MTPEIVFPVGFGGNHVRWLLSIDPKFNLPYGGPSIDDKVDWICKNIYQNRSWNQWLSKEWQYRTQFDSNIKIEHSLTQSGEMFDDLGWQNKKQLLLTVDNYTIACYHYFMVNIGLNNQTQSIIISQFTDWDKIVEKIKSFNLPNKKILKSDCISESLLDLDWYKEIVSWAEFDNLYEPASRIQTAYYQCRQQAAKDFISYFEGDEFKSHLDFYKNTYILKAHP
jgi:hypothetical protein